MIYPDNARTQQPGGQAPQPQPGAQPPRKRSSARTKAIFAIVLLSICLVGGGVLLTMNWRGSPGSSVGGNTSSANGNTITPVLSKPWCASPDGLASSFGGGSLASLGPNDVWSAGSQVNHWDGKSWSTKYTPASPQTTLRGIVELAPDNVWVVGETQGSGMASTSLVLHWDGSAWNTVTSPNAVKGGKNSLVALSASDASDIWAVGFVVPLQGPVAPFIEHWNGSKWSITHLSSSLSLQFTSVKAFAHNDAWAAGYEYGSKNGKNYVQPVTAHWNGTRWSLVSNPSLSASGGGNLYAINGDSASDIWAVGSQNSGSAMLAEHWDGSKWTVVTSPSVAPGNGNWLSSVVVSSSNSVWAVGRVSGASGFQPYIEHWDGNQWEVMQDPTGNAGELDSISQIGTQLWVTGLPQTAGGHAYIETLCP